MAEIILAILCVLAGIASGLLALIVLWGNAIGGVTNAAAVNNRPAVVLAIVAVVGVAGGVFILLF